MKISTLEQPIGGPDTGLAELHVENISDLTGLSALEGRWRALEPHFDTPFSCFDWAVAWWRNFREDRFSVADTLAVKVIRRADEVVGVAPMMLTLRPSKGPFVIRELQYLGADPNVTELRGIAVAPEHQAAAHSALCRHLAATSGDWDWAVLGGVPAALSLEPHARRHDLGLESVRTIPGYTLDVSETDWPTFKSSRPRNIKESLRRCYNSPQRAGLDLKFVVNHGITRLDEGLDNFFRLHRARSLQSDTTMHRDVFDSTAARHFLRDVGQRFADRGAFRLFELRTGDQVIACRIGFVLGDTLYLYYSGFDPEFGRHSVATRVVAEAIQYAIQQGFRRVHLSMGADRSKLRWRPDETVTQEVRLTSSGLRARFARSAYEQALKVVQSSALAGFTTRYLHRRSDEQAPESLNL